MEEQRLLTFLEFKKQLVYFALAYHKAPNKDIANDASEWADDFFKETPAPELLEQLKQLKEENERLKDQVRMLEINSDTLKVIKQQAKELERRKEDTKQLSRLREREKAVKAELQLTHGHSNTKIILQHIENAEKLLS